MKGPFELEIAWPQVEELLHASPGVEEHEEERVVATTIGSDPVGGIEKGTYLVGFEIFDKALSSPLEGHGEDPLAELKVLRMACRSVPRECVDCSEASVARRGTVAPVGLKMVEKCEDDVGSEIGEVEIRDGTPATHGDEAQ
jgi:hypothetical protein